MLYGQRCVEVAEQVICDVLLTLESGQFIEVPLFLLRGLGKVTFRKRRRAGGSYSLAQR